MNLFLALSSTFFSALWKMFLKKSLKTSKNLMVADYVWVILPFIFVFVLILVWWFHTFSIQLSQEFIVYGLIFLNFLLYALWWFISWHIYKVEKISYLIPYEYIWRIISIFWWYFYFQDVSNITFYIGLLAIFIIIFSTFNFRDFKFSTKILLFSFWQIISGFWNILAAYILVSPEKGWLWIAWIDFFGLYVLLWFLFYFLLSLLFSWGKDIKEMWGGSILFRTISWVFAYFAWFLALVVIAKLGLTLSILFWFFGVLFTMALSYLFFWDVPTKKNIILTWVIVSLVSLGFYFK
jgi:hypothetical protein